MVFATRRAVLVSPLVFVVLMYTTAAYARSDASENACSSTLLKSDAPVHRGRLKWFNSGNVAMK